MDHFSPDLFQTNDHLFMHSSIHKFIPSRPWNTKLSNLIWFPWAQIQRLKEGPIKQNKKNSKLQGSRWCFKACSKSLLLITLPVVQLNHNWKANLINTSHFNRQDTTRHQEMLQLSKKIMQWSLGGYSRGIILQLQQQWKSNLYSNTLMYRQAPVQRD